MYEDKSAVNNYQITRNEKENSSNKLKGYFQNSAFLAQQQELATFIKNLPIIKMEDVKSINKLIEMLIKQNEMIGNRCQQNFITIKECYAKHDDLLKKNRTIQHQLIETRKAIERNSISNKQIESFEGQITSLKTLLKEKENVLQTTNDELDQAKHQNAYYNGAIQHLAETIKLVSDRNYKKGLEKIRDLHRKTKENQMGWIDWDELETYFKEEKKKQKYYPKIKETVEIFCTRFLKISEHVPMDQVKDDFEKEVMSLMEILDDLLQLKKKSNMLSSQSRMSVNGGDSTFFEGLLDKVLKVRENDTLNKEDIANQLYQLREELTKSKKNYEEYQSKIKLEYEESIRKQIEKVEQKEQILQFYEEEKEKSTKDIIQTRNKILQLEQTLKAERHLAKIKNEEYETLEARFESAKSQSTLKQSETKEMWEENIKTYQYKLSQKQELIEQEQKLRKSLKLELEQKSVQLKSKVEQFQQQIKSLSQEAKDLFNQNALLTSSIFTLQKKSTEQKAYLQKQLSDKVIRCEELTRRVEKDMSEIKHLQDEVQECEREKSLQIAYIKQIQSKSNELLVKMKSLESKKSEEKTAKKEINAIKQTMLEEKKISREIQQNFSNQKQENQRLKAIIKQMKKELEDVYQQFNHLKMIQQDREALISEIEKSDRIKQQLCREYEELKMQLITAEQHNKGLSIEVRHYRNALSRIEALR